ncbi:uncharacterized protein LOC119193633, partial [Manduca sexta]|uniref:uncharacterized protein LOC119193633 n=1 Tax=Manduca sexta TaxID=7130 RepID=UPI00188DDC5E
SSSGLYSMFMSLASESVPMAKRNLVVLLISSIFLLAQGVMAVLAIPVVPLRFSHHLPALGIYWNSWRTLVIVYSLPSIVQSLLLDSTEKNEEKSSAKDQIVPLFKMPLLKYTIIMILLFAFQQIGSFLVWLPTILNQFITNIETGEGTNLTVCGVLRLGIENPIEPDPDAVPCAINETALLMLLAVGVMKSVVNSLLSLIVNKVGRRNLVMMISALCGICGILVNLVPNAYGSIVLFGIFSVGIIVLGFYTAIIVALFPTHLRALAIALPLTCGRLAVFAGIQILNVLLTINCDVGFYVFATIYASSAIVASFLPDDRKLVPTVAPSEDKELTQKEEMPQRSMTEL